MEIAILITRIILLILKGMSSENAVYEIASMSSFDFAQLWSHLPCRYR